MLLTVFLLFWRETIHCYYIRTQFSHEFWSSDFKNLGTWLWGACRFTTVTTSSTDHWILCFFMHFLSLKSVNISTFFQFKFLFARNIIFHPFIFFLYSFLLVMRTSHRRAYYWAFKKTSWVTQVPRCRPIDPGLQKLKQERYPDCSQAGPQSVTLLL